MHSPDLTFLIPGDVTLSQVPGSSSIRIIIKDRLCVLSGRIRRAFPLSQPTSYFSLQDEAGKEVGVLTEETGLDSESKRVLDREINRRYFTPSIRRIVALKQEGGMWTWDVDTNRGAARFYVRSWRDSSHEIQAGRFQIQSVDGQRYEIPSYDDLDDRSKLFIEQLF